MGSYPDVSILMGMTDREIREDIAKGDAHGEAVLAAMLRERGGNPPSPIESFRDSNTMQLEGEMLVCRRGPVEHTMVIDGGWGGCLAQTPEGEILLIDSFQKMMSRSTDAGSPLGKRVKLCGVALWQNHRHHPLPAGVGGGRR